MEVQGQNKIINISKFCDYECYINPNYITKIYKAVFNDYYTVVVVNSEIYLYKVETKSQLNEFLDYIYSK